MVAETRYITVSGQPPNGGVPFGTMFYKPPSPAFNPALNPPNRGPDLPPPYPPPFNAQQNDGNGQVYRVYGQPGPLRPEPAPPGPAPNHPDYDPPGQMMEGYTLHGNGWSWIFPSHDEITTINFVAYPHHRPLTWVQYKMPARMTVGDLIKQLGAPEGNQYGITEMDYRGNGVWFPSRTIMQGGVDANRSLGDMGWTARFCATAGAVFIAINDGM